ncbi:MAG: PrgI family protein [Patescibacteria group bacterium]
MPLKETSGLSNKQHAVPQNIMQVEFKIIGDLTMRQFFYLLIAAIFAFGAIKSGLPSYVAWPLGIVAALAGVAIAFVPIQDRGMDQWVAFFFQAIYQPTLRVWRKETLIPQYFLYQSAALLKSEMLTIAPTASRRKLEEYLERASGDLKKKDYLDEKEEEYIKKVRAAFEPSLANARPTTPQTILNTQATAVTAPPQVTTQFRPQSLPQTHPSVRSIPITPTIAPSPKIPIYQAPKFTPPSPQPSIPQAPKPQEVNKASGAQEKVAQQPQQQSVPQASQKPPSPKVQTPEVLKLPDVKKEEVKIITPKTLDALTVSTPPQTFVKPPVQMQTQQQPQPKQVVAKPFEPPQVIEPKVIEVAKEVGREEAPIFVDITPKSEEKPEVVENIIEQDKANLVRTELAPGKESTPKEPPAPALAPAPAPFTSGPLTQEKASLTQSETVAIPAKEPIQEPKVQEQKKEEPHEQEQEQEQERAEIIKPSRSQLRQNFPITARIGSFKPKSQGTTLTPAGITGRRFTNLTPTQGEIVLPIRGERILRMSGEPEPPKSQEDMKRKEKLDQLNALVEKLKVDQKSSASQARLSIPPLNISALTQQDQKKEEKIEVGNPFKEVAVTEVEKKTAEGVGVPAQQTPPQTSQTPKKGSMYLPPERLMWTGPEPTASLKKEVPKDEKVEIKYDIPGKKATDEEIEKHLIEADSKLTKEIEALNMSMKDSSKTEAERKAIQDQIKRVETERVEAQKVITGLETKVKELEQKLTETTSPQVVVQKVVEKVQVPVIHDSKEDTQLKQPKAPVLAKVPTITTLPNSINGVVKDNNGKLVEGAVVMIKDPRGDVVRALRTNKLGQFFITTAVANGSYIVEVSFEKDNIALNFDSSLIQTKGEVLPPIEFTGKI